MANFTDLLRDRLEALIAENAELRADLAARTDALDDAIKAGRQALAERDQARTELERWREYLLETSGRLHQLASETNGLSTGDMQALANDICALLKETDYAASQVEAMDRHAKLMEAYEAGPLEALARIDALGDK